ncbi:MAG: outer membrane lipoprotein-sorting protein [Verrucomicrobiota bacterium]
MTRPLLLLFGALLLTGFTETAPPRAVDPAEAARQGSELVGKILALQPSQNYTNTGVLKVRPDRGEWTETPLRFAVLVTPTNWQSVYQTTSTNQCSALRVISAAGTPKVFLLQTNSDSEQVSLANSERFQPFAGSDFWVGDLGLDFLQWPGQKLVKSELRKTRLCRVLESTPAQPATNGYSRVMSWIDSESFGLVHADAYDAAGKILKEFDPKSVKEIDGQPQLLKMEMYNRQTRSRSQIEFDLPVE